MTFVEVMVNWVSACVVKRWKFEPLYSDNPLYCYPFESTNALTIPSRTVTTFYVHIKNTEKVKGYIPRLHIQDGVNVGDAVVKNHKGKVYLKYETQMKYQ